MSNCTSLLFPQNITTISQCQSTATSPFCWPPNGTRICVPTPSNLTLFWPPSYYTGNVRLTLTYNLGRNVYPAGNNTGNDTFEITKALWTDYALDTGVKDERSVTVYMKSMIYGSGDVGNHAGPTLILVKTSEFPSPTPRPRVDYDSNDEYDPDVDALTGLTDAGMAGVIVGVIVGIIGLIVLCCWRGWCCCGREGDKEKRMGMLEKMGREEREGRVKDGVELMAGRGTGIGKVVGAGDGDGGGEFRTGDGRTGEYRTLDPGRRAVVDRESMVDSDLSEEDEDEIRVMRERLEEQVRDYVDPPPLYKP